jgi:threonine synthase
MRAELKYVSTRGEVEKLGFEDVVLAGLARDGGLYVPASWPVLSPAAIASFAKKSFAEIAVDVIHPFTGDDDVSRADLARMAEEAYASFDSREVTPLHKLRPGLTILELFHGPTLAFKDVAMQLLARLMDHVLAKRGKRATIVGATSGDTGGAAIEAFRTSKRVDVVILFPEGRVSDVQRRMMTTPKEKNVHALAIRGTFDDCQALIKAMFNDHAFRDRVALSGVNSINWARIVAQVTYYFFAASRLGSKNGPLSFAVPTGNFGDIFAGYVAKRMGLPIGKLIIASNENDILPRAVATGVYAMRDVIATSSPSMDIQVSSNFERYLFEASGRDADLVRNLMASLTANGRFELGRLSPTLKTDFAAVSASETDVADCIRETEARYGYLLDPHTACALVAAERSPDGATIVLATAHPGKFPDAIETITGKRPPLPQGFEHLMTDEERFEVLPNSLAAIEEFVVHHSRVASGVLR